MLVPGLTVHVDFEEFAGVGSVEFDGAVGVEEAELGGVVRRVDSQPDVLEVARVEEDARLLAVVRSTDRREGHAGVLDLLNELIWRR